MNAWLYWAAFLLAVVSIQSDLHALRFSAWSFAGVFAVVGALMLIHPPLRTLGNGRWSLLIAMLALTPPAWLALLDHLATYGQVRWPGKTNARRPRGACFWTGLYVWAVFAAIGGLRILAAHDARIAWPDCFTAIAWNLILHLTFASHRTHGSNTYPSPSPFQQRSHCSCSGSFFPRFRSTGAMPA